MEAPEIWQLQGLRLNEYCIPVQYLGGCRERGSMWLLCSWLAFERRGSSIHAAAVSGLRARKPHGTIAPLMDFFDSSPTVLRHPVWYSDTASEAATLPLSADNYSVAPVVGADGRWTVTSSTGELVYRGIGQVTVTQG